MKFYIPSILLLCAAIITSCDQGNESADAYGNFEATEVVISSEVNGKILDLTFEEGDLVQANKTLGLVDTISLYLRKKQLQSSMSAIRSKLVNEKVQIDVLLRQQENLKREVKRVDQLFAEGAATSKQRDDIHGELNVLNNQIASVKSQLSTANQGLLAELAPLSVQVEQIDDQIRRSVLGSPISGTILAKYAEPGEITAFGKPLFKIADMQTLTLRAYVSAPQLSSLKIGQLVTVSIDDENGGLSEYPGNISWIASTAEFTPKIIQTKDERVNLVYAIKVSVTNDGFLKIGMPGEVKFN